MLTAWIKNNALPLWGSVGFDPLYRRFVERLDLLGRPQMIVPNRVMVQARQIYVFSHAARLGWSDNPAGLAEDAMASLLRDYRTNGDGGGFAFSIACDGRVISETRDSYAHAFVLFALASLYRLNGDKRLLLVADQTIAFLDRVLTDAKQGGLFDAFPMADSFKRQNPHMHLLEAYLSLEDAASGRGYIARAHEIVSLFERRLLDRSRGILPEYYAPDWAPHPDPVKAAIFEPGHHFEWIWLLRKYETLSGRNLDEIINMLERSALSYGFNEDGLIFDEVLADGTVHKPSSRIWPHTEAIKSAVAQYHTGAHGSVAFAERMTRVLQAHFLDQPVAGAWIDHIDDSGHPLVDYVPASSLYHLFLAATESDAAFGPAAKTNAF